MSQLATFELYDVNGTPLTGVVPTFVTYKTRTGGAPITTPTVTEIGVGKYAFIPNDVDLASGVAWVVNGGVNAVPQYVYGQEFEQGNPFEALLFIDAVGALFVGAGTPAFSLYSDAGGNAKPRPALVRIASYLYTFTPSGDDLSTGVGWVLSAPTGALPTYYEDTVVGSIAPTVVLFGCDEDLVRRHRFPQVNRFSADSNPTSATINEIIAQKAAELEAKLLTEGVSSHTIIDTTSAPYLWCQETVILATASRVLQSMSGQDPKLAESWRKELKARYDDLDERGGVAIGLKSLTDQPEGPNSHIQEYSLDIGDPTTEAGDVIPALRRGDEL